MIASAPTSEQYLEELRCIAQEVLAQSNTFFAHLGIEQLNWKPAPTSWSIAQCYQHLIVLNSLYCTSLERGMATSTQERDNAQRPFTSGIVGRWFRTLVEPQTTRPLPTFSMFMPTASTIPTSILSDFAQTQHLLMQYMEQARSINLVRTYIATPASRFLRLRLGDVFAVLLAHEQRHVAQAQRVAHHADFPR